MVQNECALWLSTMTIPHTNPCPLSHRQNTNSHKCVLVYSYNHVISFKPATLSTALVYVQCQLSYLHNKSNQQYICTSNTSTWAVILLYSELYTNLLKTWNDQHLTAALKVKTCMLNKTVIWQDVKYVYTFHLCSLLHSSHYLRSFMEDCLQTQFKPLQPVAI